MGNRLLLVRTKFGEPDYWRYLSPRFGDEQFRETAIADAELTMDDSPARTWFIAVNEDDRVMGMCSQDEQDRPVRWGNNYVLAPWRGMGIFTMLFHYRLGFTPPGAVVETFVYTSLIRIHKRHGFVIVESRGNTMPDGSRRNSYAMLRP